MRRARSLWIAQLFFCSALSFLSRPAEACSWIDRPFSEFYEEADEIVIARIEAVVLEESPPQPRQHVAYSVVERLKGAGGQTGSATASTFLFCGGGMYLPGQDYLLFIAGEDRTVNDRSSRTLSNVPDVRARRLQPLRDYQTGTWDGLTSLNAYAYDADTPTDLEDYRCKGLGLKGVSNFPFYPTLRNAYAKSDIVVRVQITSQVLDVPTGTVVVGTRVIETYKGEQVDSRSFVTPVFGSPEWMEGCLVYLNGWEYLIYANSAEGNVDERHSTALMPSIPRSEFGSSSDAESTWLDKAQLRGLEMLRFLGSE